MWRGERHVGLAHSRAIQVQVGSNGLHDVLYHDSAGRLARASHSGPRRKVAPGDLHMERVSSWGHDIALHIATFMMKET